MKNETDKMRRLYDQWQFQSMSKHAFCNQNGLGYHKFNHWVKKIKGELKETMKKLALEKLIIFNPDLLLRKNTDWLGQRISSTVTQFLKRLGILKKIPLHANLNTGAKTGQSTGGLGKRNTSGRVERPFFGCSIERQFGSVLKLSRVLGCVLGESAMFVIKQFGT